MIDSKRFYDRYYGHPIEDIEHIVKTAQPYPLIYLAGDSTLDNKYWLSDKLRLDAPNAVYEKILRPPTCKPDVCYWINNEQEQYVCVNCATEEKSLSSGWSAQDQVVAENISEQDVLVVSIGGNDFALKPTIGTLISSAALFYLTPQWVIDSGYAIPLWYLTSVFKQQLKIYLKSLTAHTTPSKIIVCSVYYPCKQGRGWANRFLNLIGYENCPQKVHSLIDRFHTDVLEQIDGITALKLSSVLDWECAGDYCERVEPSSQGGKKIATAILQSINEKREF